ncbi:MAG: dihydrofolate reductase [Pseudomonadota bacterium]|nr:dihydrofolate reductase [Pseudomonadota bacterium]
MHIAIYVAIAENGVIGSRGGLPWRLSTDLKRFKAATMGKPIIMGRKTWESFPRRPLPGRLNIVVTRDKAYHAEGGETVGSLPEAVALAKVRARCMTGVDELCVIGGGEIYAQALPLADRLHVTHVLGQVDGDTVFPPIDPTAWRLASSEDVPSGEKDTHATRYAVYERRAPVH